MRRTFRPLRNEALRAAFCVVLGLVHVLFTQFDTPLEGFLLSSFRQVWVVTLKPVVGFGDWVGLWGTAPTWGAWLYAGVLVGLGVAGYWSDGDAVDLSGIAFFGVNLALYWVLYLWNEWGRLGDFLVGDVLYTLLMGIGIAFFVGDRWPVSTLRGLSGGETTGSAAGETAPRSNGPPDGGGDARNAGGADAQGDPADGAGRTADGRREDQDRLREQVTSLRATVDEAEALLDDGQRREARTRLEATDGRIERLKRSAVDRGWYDLNEELTAIERRRDRLAEACSRGIRQSIPAVPRAPDVAVDYDALSGEEPIGGGGNADVTRARLPTPDGDVTLAIKRPRMSGTLHADTVDRLLQEAETWDKLDDHDHVVGVVDYGAQPLPWIAMEYMDAGDLGDRAGELAFDQALWTALAITKAVRHAHRRGVAHLDLKPANVLFRSVDGAWDVPKVADWGLSKHLLEHSKSVEGLSPQYAAPEQFDSDRGPADDITDVYQLGAVLYELFTGRPPFEGEPAEAMHRTLYEAPAPPSEVADLPPALDDVLLTALAKERDDRYGDIVYLRDDLQALFEDR
jgi:hypothetical protein